MSIYSPPGSEQPPSAPFTVEAPRPQDDIGLALGNAFSCAGAVPADMIAMLVELDRLGKKQSPRAQ